MDSKNNFMKTESAQAIPRLKRLLPHLRKVRMAVIGDLMLDRYVWGTAHRLSPEAAVPVVDLVSESNCLGGAGNVAANLASLGARVRIFGVVGGRAGHRNPDDEAGGELRACLRRAGVEDRGVVADAHRITTVKTRIIARHQQIVRIDRERRETLSAETEERLFRMLLATLKTVDAVVLSDYDKGAISNAFAERILHASHKSKIPVFVKPNTSRRLAYRGARAIVCNAKEAGFYVSRALTEEKSFEEAGRALLAHFGSAAVVITRGEAGMSVFEENSPTYVNIPATSFEVTYERLGQAAVDRRGSGRQVFDVTGAGDTVLSVLSLAVVAGANLAEAAYLANTAAGVVVGKLGTAMVTPIELAAALDET